MQELVFNALDTNNSGTISFRFSIENALVPFPRCQGVVAGRVHLPEGNPWREACLDFQALRHGWQWQHWLRGGGFLWILFLVMAKLCWRWRGSLEHSTHTFLLWRMKKQPQGLRCSFFFLKIFAEIGFTFCFEDYDSMPPLFRVFSSSLRRIRMAASLRSSSWKRWKTRKIWSTCSLSEKCWLSHVYLQKTDQTMPSVEKFKLWHASIASYCHCPYFPPSSMAGYTLFWKAANILFRQILWHNCFPYPLQQKH